MKLYREDELCALAKQCRLAAGKSRAEAANELKVSTVTVFNAEETPAQSLTKARVRLIETYGNLKVTGPVFVVKKR